MRIVSENSEADLKARRALEEAGYMLRNLTANLLRITRGAGKPYEVVGQAALFVKAVQEYDDLKNQPPSPADLVRLLTSDKDWDYVRKLSGDEFEKNDAEQSIIDGSLQIVASRLLSQRTQEMAGRSQFYEGFNRVSDIRAKIRAEIARQSSAPKRRKKSTKRKPSKTQRDTL